MCSFGPNNFIDYDVYEGLCNNVKTASFNIWILKFNKTLKYKIRKFKFYVKISKLVQKLKVLVSSFILWIFNFF